MAGELRRIEEFLANQIGLDPVSVGSRLVLRAAQHRMSALQLDDLSQYEQQLYESASEVQFLIERVIVPESWFFRNAGPYQWLSRYARAHWLPGTARPPARILSLGCAGGEEPYSISMAMVDVGVPPSRFRIDAADISLQQLARARRGVYSAHAFRGGRDLDYRRRFFREHSDGFEIDPAIRSTVQFFEANVLDPQFVEKFPVYEVIFCRNLLIYLHPAARASVTCVLDRLLALDGMLVIGHADRFEWDGREPKFVAVEEPGCFVYSRAVPLVSGRAEPQPESAQPMPSSVALDHSAQAALLSPSDTRGIAGSPSTSSTAALAPPACEPGSLLSQAALLANQGRHMEAVATCKRDLQLRGPSAPAYFLMGIIYQSQGERRQAEACFHKTVYLDPNHDEALLALALLVEQRGEHKAARAFRRRAARNAAVTRHETT